MDDLMSKLQNVLNDKESMAQISELAKMLGGSDNGAGDKAPPSGGGGLSELSMLLGGGGNSNAAPSSPSGGGGIDPQMMMKIGAVISAANRNDKNINLLYALKPMLSEDKQQKIDRLISIFRLMSAYPALRDSGLLGGEGFGLFK